MAKKKKIKVTASLKVEAGTSDAGKQRRSELHIPQGFPFTKWNFIWMGVGLVLIVLGYVMMYDGDGKDIFAPERITYPTILVMLGYAVEIYAILARFGGRKKDAPKEQA